MYVTFANNDIENTFNLEGIKTAGAFNQLFWEVDTGNDLDDDESSIVSTHEFAHGILNNGTTYGTLIQLFAMIRQEHRIEFEDRIDQKAIALDTYYRKYKSCYNT